MWDQLQILRQQYIDQRIMDSIDYEKFCMISIVYNSSKIEGCSLSETDTKVLIENNITAKGKPLTDHLMVRDHYNAFLKIKEDTRIKRRLSIDFIREIGSSVMSSTGSLVNTISGSFDTSMGDIRLAQVYVDKKYFPDFTKVPELLKKLVNVVNERLDIVEGNEIIKPAAI